MSMVEGIIFNIQRFSVHDGPGIRTVVFVKGCPLRCKWCANPESQLSDIELAWTKEKCIGCRCCENSELKPCFCFRDDDLYWDRFDKTKADLIERICPSNALHIVGYKTDVASVIDKIDRDEMFYSNLDGGLTISGGEPLMQPDFTYELLKEARSEGINTAIETTGYAKYEVLRKIVSLLDYLIMDIKSLDDKAHKQNTGVSNRIILDNFVKLRKDYPALPILIRTPVIPGFNDTKEAIGDIHSFLLAYDNIRYELLKYHRLGEAKYISLHREYPMKDAKLDDELYAELKERFEFDHIVKDQLFEDGGGI